jgi:hypothetical protein
VFAWLVGSWSGLRHGEHSAHVFFKQLNIEKMKKIAYVFIIILCICGCQDPETTTDDIQEYLYPVQYPTGLYGYIDKTGKLIIEPIYYNAFDFYYGMAVVQTQNNPRSIYKYINLKGELIGSNFIVPFPFTKDGFALVQISSNEYNFINKEGYSLVLSQNFPGARSFQDGMAAVYNADLRKWGFINTKGELVIPYLFYDVAPFNEGFAFVYTIALQSGCGIINKKGEFVASSKDWEIDIGHQAWMTDHPGASLFSYGLAPVKVKVDDNYKVGYVNYNGEFVISPIYSSGENFYEGYARIQYGDYCLSFIDKEGELINSECYEYCSHFSEGYAVICHSVIGYSPLYGYIDKNGNKVIPCMYNSANMFRGDLAKVEFGNETTGYINKKNEIIWRSF